MGFIRTWLTFPSLGSARFQENLRRGLIGEPKLWWGWAASPAFCSKSSSSRAIAFLELVEKSPYKHLLDDKDFRRWWENIRRGSITYAYESLRRMGYIEKRFGKSPKEIAQLPKKNAEDFILDLVGELEKENKSGSYISNCVKPLKSWLAWNGTEITKKIKISKRDDLTRFSEEKPPTPEELKRIFLTTDLRIRAAAGLVAFSGVRIEVLGDYLGLDGLKLKDLPEMVSKGAKVAFKEIPATVVVRKALSKTNNQYFSFLCEEGCQYLQQYLEWRMMKGEKLKPESPLITPVHQGHVGKHIRTNNIGDLIKKGIKEAGFTWRPYVLRRYFDTRLMLAEADGLIIRDYRTFWMGHSGDIEHTYTVNKGLSGDVIEKMRDSYGKASEKYLETSGRKETVTKEDMVSEFNKQFLRMSGYTDDEIGKLGDLSQVSPSDMQDLVRKKSYEMLGLNGNNQKVVPLLELRNYIVQGWEYVRELPNNEAIVRLPGR